MVRAGALLPLLCCLLLQGGLRPGVAQETPDGWSTLASPRDSLAASVGPAEGAGGISLHTTSPYLSSAPKDATGLQPSTSGPAEEGPTKEADVTSEEPGSEEPAYQVTSSSRPNTTIASSSGDTSAEDGRNSTANTAPAPTDEADPSGLNSTIEGEPMQPTWNISLTTPGKEPGGTGTLGVFQTKESPSTAPGPTTPQTNGSRETTQAPAAAGETTEDSPVLSSTTRAADVATSTRATTVIVTTTVSSTTTSATTTTATTKLAPADGKKESSILDVGDDENEVPAVPSRALSSTDPLVVAVISVFIIMVGILALVGFLRYRQRSSRTEFRRLQDVPMDDMMEDTPLSLYSY